MIPNVIYLKENQVLPTLLQVPNNSLSGGEEYKINKNIILHSLRHRSVAHL